MDNKTFKKKAIYSIKKQVCIDEEINDKLIELCKKNNWSFSEAVRNIVESWLADEV